MTETTLRFPLSEAVSKGVEWLEFDVIPGGC